MIYQLGLPCFSVAVTEYDVLFAIDINELYPLRIIGLNQDEKASGGMAGLTFVFLQNPNMSVTDPGQYENGSSNLRQFVAGSGGAMYKGLPASIIDSIERVNKNHRSKSNNIDDANLSNIVPTSESIFVLSVFELKGNPPKGSALGVGSGKSEEYLHWSSNLFSDDEKRKRISAVYPSDSWARDSVADIHHWALNGHRGIFAGGLTGTLPVQPAFCF